jgi:hypothetical protein
LRKQVHLQVVFLPGKADNGKLVPKSQARPLFFRSHTIRARESGAYPRALKGSKVLSSVSGTEPAFLAADTIHGGCVCSASRVERGEFFSELAGIQDMRKGPPVEAGGPLVSLIQNAACSEGGSGAGTCGGTSASARFKRRTELARTLQKIANFAAFAFLDLPFSFSYFELTSCPSTRT